MGAVGNCRKGGKCWMFWWKSCAAILREIAGVNVVFMRFCPPTGGSDLPLGISRVAKHAKPRPETPCFEPRKVRDRLAKRHVSQEEMRNLECEMWSFWRNVLNVSELNKVAENGAFRPNHFFVAKNRVVLCVDCCDNSKLVIRPKCVSYDAFALSGRTNDNTIIPRVSLRLPWAMCSLGFQPV